MQRYNTSQATFSLNVVDFLSRRRKRGCDKKYFYIIQNW